MKFIIEHLSKNFETKEVLKDINFTFEEGKIYGLLGRNGAGKTTLFNCVNGDLKTDSGNFYLEDELGHRRKVIATDIGYVLSTPTVPEFLTGREFLKFFMDINEKSIKDPKSIDEYFDYMSIDPEDRDKLLKDYSHGMKNKMQMLINIIAQPNILLLDEPTNHLDVETVEWLEDYIRNYEKAAVIVSHDRYFLDAVAGTVYELEKGGLTRYAGNYSAYRKQREKNRQIQMKKYLAQQEEIKRLTELIGRFKHKPKKAAMARSKKKVLEREKMYTFLRRRSRPGFPAVNGCWMRKSCVSGITGRQEMYRRLPCASAADRRLVSSAPTERAKRPF